MVDAPASQLAERLLQFQPTKTQDAQKRILKMVSHERMGGSVPVWVKQEETPQIVTAAKKVEQDLSVAANALEEGPGPPSEFAHALSFHADQSRNHSPDHSPAAQEPFDMGDLMDMVNPLQHIPVVGHLYRQVTGDEMRPISRIVGGTVFGGAIGAASGLVNAMIEQETGRDIAGNAMAMLTDGQAPQMKSTAGSDAPETRLTQAVRIASDQEALNSLPVTLLAFADTGQSRAPVMRMTQTTGQNAGDHAFRGFHDFNLQLLGPRQPITELAMASKPERSRYND